MMYNFTKEGGPLFINMIVKSTRHLFSDYKKLQLYHIHTRRKKLTDAYKVKNATSEDFLLCLQDQVRY